MAISAFVVKVPAAEPLVADLRARHDATAALGVPAHITLLVPFMDPAHITPAVLTLAQQALARTPAFAFVLGRIGRFPDTAWLAPEPVQPFIDMTLALAAAFPAHPPYGGAFDAVIPHLTVAHGDAATANAAAAELDARLTRAGPLQTHCTEVALIENATGHWRDLWRFPLTPSIP